MDKVSQVIANSNFESIKEPRGFIRIIELVLAIFAFATTCSHSTSTSFEFLELCNKEDTDKIGGTFGFGYTYNLQSGFTYDNCSKSIVEVSPYGNYSAPSQFYVFVGVMAFLYCLAALVLYICFDDKYRQYDKIPMADFIITAVFTLLWLISSAAWADGVAKVKKYSDPEEMWTNGHLDECWNSTDQTALCEVTDGGDFASLNVSIIFGFLNMVVWGGNLWFLFKETAWFKVETEHPTTSPSETPQKFYDDEEEYDPYAVGP